MRSFKTISAVLVLAQMGMTAMAADGIWKNGSGGDWSTAGNWSNSIVADGAGFTAFFTNAISNHRTNVNDSARTIGYLEFSNGGVISYSWTLAGTAGLTLSGGGGVSDIRWLMPVSILATLAGSDDVRFSGSSVAGLWMRGTNTYAGATILRKGNLTAAGNVPSGANSPLGNATSAVQIGDAGTLGSDNLQFLMEGSGATFARPLEVNSHGNSVTIGNLASSSDFMTWSGDITLNRSVLLASRAIMTLSGKISGPGGFVRTSSDQYGTIIFTGDNDFSGDLTNSRGVMVAANANAFGTATTAIQLGDTNTGGNPVSLLISNGVTVARELLVSADTTGPVSIGMYGGAPGTFAGPIRLERSILVAPKSGTSLTVSSPISGVGGLTSLGNSDAYVYLTCPTNSFTGNVTVGNGFLVISNDVHKNQPSPLGASESTILITAPSGSAATLYVDANGRFERDILVTNTTTSSAIGTRTATNLLFTSSLVVSNSLFDINVVNATNLIEWSGTFSGTGTVRKTGSGVLIVSSTNSSFAGGFSLGSGTLRLSGPAPLGNGPFLFSSFGPRLENNFGAYFFTNKVEIIRQFGYYGVYDLVFTGDKKINGNTTAYAITVDQANVLLGFRGNLVSYDSGTIEKLGAGILDWGGTNLTANFTNNIILSAGALRAYEGTGISTQNTIRFIGGVWESSGSCTRVLGSTVGAGMIHWGNGAAGGFSAYGAPFTVDIGGAASNLYWASNSFAGAAAELLFGSARADHAVVFKNPIDVNSLQRSIRVYDNTNSIADKAVLEGGMILGSWGVKKEGPGVLVLDGTNTGTAAVTVNGGTLLVDGELLAPIQCKTNTWLGGRGTIKRSVTLDAGFAGFNWDDAPGTLTVQTNLTLPKGFTYNFRGVDGQLPLVNVTGTLTVSNAVTVNMFGETQTPVVLFSAGTLAGTTNIANWVVTGSTKPYAVSVTETNIVVSYQKSGSIFFVR